ARYLRSTEFTETVVHLPDGARTMIDRVFGARHFSWRCVLTSIAFSFAAFALLACLTVLYDPRWVSIARRAWQTYPVLINMAVAWIIWSIVPDYFNLLKTRKVLDLITAYRMKSVSLLIAILVADFLIGYAIFIVTFVPIGLLDVHLFFYVMGMG